MPPDEQPAKFLVSRILKKVSYSDLILRRMMAGAFNSIRFQQALQVSASVFKALPETLFRYKDL